MYDALSIGTGLFWLLAYAAIIYRGFADRSTGMPIPALAANIAWEGLFAFIYPAPEPQRAINIAWVGLDAIILFQAFRFGPSQRENIWRGWGYYIGLGASLICALFIAIQFTVEFHDYLGVYLAFGQNLMMSILFIAMLQRRASDGAAGVEGQSLYIAIFKMLGTGLSSILFHLKLPHSGLLNFTYVAILVFDLIYVALLYRRFKQLSPKVWARI